jgi:hypothetical protein
MANPLNDAIARMDVVELDAEMVVVLKMALAEIKTDVGSQHTPAIVRAERLLDAWQKSGIHNECGGKDHQHTLRCPVLREMTAEAPV